MSIKITFTNVKCLVEGLWRVQLTKNEAQSFAPAGARKASHGVFLLKGAYYEPTNKALEVPIGGIEVVAVGEGDSTILIDATLTSDLPEELLPKNREKPKKNGVGIPGFLDSCRANDLPDDLIRSVARLLSRLEKEIDFELVEGEQRKWTAKPNFIALTIQNRNKQILISVKGEPSEMENLTISPKIGRPPYCEFHFKSPEQFDDTLSVARLSASK